MDFPEIVEYFKGLRHAHQTLPFPVPYPPHLICLDGETTVCQVATPYGDAQSIAAMLSAIAVVHAVWPALDGVDGPVRAEVAGIPIGQDPNAKPGLLTVGAHAGASQVAVDAFSTDDGGAIDWLPGEWWSPLTSLLAGAMAEVFAAEVPNSVADFVTWMQLNHYAIKVHPSLYNPGDE